MHARHALETVWILPSGIYRNNTAGPRACAEGVCTWHRSWSANSSTFQGFLARMHACICSCMSSRGWRGAEPTLQKLGFIACNFASWLPGETMPVPPWKSTRPAHRPCDIAIVWLHITKPVTSTVWFQG